MATIGSLAVQLTANTARFQRGLRQAQRRTRSFSLAVRKSLSVVTKFGSVLTGVAVGGGLAVLVKRSLDAVDALAKTSDKLGITTEQLAALRLAAERTGVETSKLEMALQRMVRRISEAAMGTGEAVAALEELGLSAEALNRLAPDEQFRRIADAMARVENQSDRVRLAFKLFDSEGVALVNTLALGREGLARYADEAERLGLTISRYDAAKVEAAKDAFDRLGNAISAAGQLLAADLAPSLVVVAETLTDLVVKTRGLGQATQVEGGIIAAAIGVIHDTIVGLKLAARQFALLSAGLIDMLLTKVISFGKGVLTLFQVLTPLATQSIDQIKASLDGLDTVLTATWSGLAAVEKQALATSKTFSEKLAAAAREIREEFERMRREAEEATRALDDTAAKADETAEKAKKAAEDEREIEAMAAAAPAAAELERERRVGEFGQGAFSRIAFQGAFGSRAEKTATERGQKAVEELLKRIEEHLANPAPVTMRFE